ncbi:hypothetical protein [Zongyangia hominis]|uniref:Uncharacterized protein n=1 Tax=Zongyangia hominis TaxID=2763677 RepID=A0A926EDD7_9FIRM|nr:hypothetical protein [Zongyangia hominis]MBC8569697.1 hypothetical protein [Zongyangia hominis]
MKLLVLILNKVEMLEPLLARFTDLQINGATILNSTGMARALSDYMDDSFLGSLRAILDPDRDENKTILTVLKDEQVESAIGAIEEVVGDLSEPDTGIVFTLPVDFIKGVHLD